MWIVGGKFQMEWTNINIKFSWEYRWNIFLFLISALVPYEWLTCGHAARVFSIYKRENHYHHYYQSRRVFIFILIVCVIFWCEKQLRAHSNELWTKAGDFSKGTSCFHTRRHVWKKKPTYAHVTQSKNENWVIHSLTLQIENNFRPVQG